MHGGGGRGMMRGLAPRESDLRPIRRATVRRVLTFFRPYRFRVALTVTAIIVTAIIGLANPYLLKLIIDDAIPRGDRRVSTSTLP
jgi:ATP-binding cassette subfamily B protein